MKKKSVPRQYWHCIRSRREYWQAYAPIAELLLKGSRLSVDMNRARKEGKIVPEKAYRQLEDLETELMVREFSLRITAIQGECRYKRSFFPYSDKYKGEIYGFREQVLRLLIYCSTVYPKRPSLSLDRLKYIEDMLHSLQEWGKSNHKYKTIKIEPFVPFKVNNRVEWTLDPMFLNSKLFKLIQQDGLEEA